MKKAATKIVTAFIFVGKVGLLSNHFIEDLKKIYESKPFLEKIAV